MCSSSGKRPLGLKEFMDRILVLDGDARSALAVVRSLGRLDVELGVAACGATPLAHASRFVMQRFRCPDPGDSPDAWRAWLLETVDAWQPHMLLPLTDVSLGIVLGMESRLREATVLPCVDEATFHRVANKSTLLALAEDLGIRAPATLVVPPRAERSEDDSACIEAFAYPAVLKTNYTQSDLDDRFVRLPVAYPNDASAARALVEGDGAYRDVEVLLQQRIVGPGTGVFALCADGRAHAVFAHRRLLEKPPTGGVSVLSEGIPLEQAPVGDALRLLERLHWQGMAMVEWKRHSDGHFYLMEINPRFWGSLQLAIDSGRDYPALLYRLFRSGEALRGPKLERFAEEIPELVPGRRLRWLLGTVDHALIRLEAMPLLTLREIIFRNCLGLFRAAGKTRLEVLRPTDPRPFAAELRAWVRALRGG